LENRVLNTIHKFNLIENGDKIVLGVSGGPDSLFMLDILNKIRNNEKYNLNFEIVVAHINHMIREEANSEEEFVKDFCQKINVPFFAKRIDVVKYANNNKIGTEEAGRNIRYEFFDEVMKKTDSNKIAIAHNKNDKAETIIMNILRGSGISGLKGIEPTRENKIIRPIIEIEREAIEEYCEENKLDPRIDKSNLENIYTRNKIRNILIPLIKEEFNPNIIETITRLSEVVKEENEILNVLVKEKFRECLLQEKKDEIILNLKQFNMQEKVIKKRLILYTISKLKGSTQGIEKIHIEDIIKLCEKNIGNKFLTPKKNLKVAIQNKKIFFQINFNKVK